MIKLKDYWQAAEEEKLHVRLISEADCAWCGAYPRVRGPYCEECVSDPVIRNSSLLWQIDDRVQRIEGKTPIGIVEGVEVFEDREGCVWYAKVRWCDTHRTSVVRADRLKAAPKESGQCA